MSKKKPLTSRNSSFSGRGRRTNKNSNRNYVVNLVRVGYKNCREVAVSGVDTYKEGGTGTGSWEMIRVWTG